MANPVSGLTAALLILDEPPAQEPKEECRDAFVDTNPYEETRREFRALLETASGMRPVQVILCTTQQFKPAYQTFASFVGSLDHKTASECLRSP
jgi:hypothetical protein